MVRVAIVAEGQTEAEFTTEVLADHLRPRNVEPTPVVMDGNVSAQRLAVDMARLYGSYNAVTSLVDFYGFKQKRSSTVEQLEAEVRDLVHKRIHHHWDERRVFPYVQRHEFEALLFTDVDAFSYIGVNEEGIGRLQEVQSRFATPEDINDHHDTAPSKRISQVVRYDKTADGPVIAVEIGLEKMRSACPRFGAWLARLEALDSR